MIFDSKTKPNNSKKYTATLLVLGLGLALTACQDVINLDVPAGASQLVVDGWITNQSKTQTIKLTESAPYFDNSPAKPVLNATVTVTDDIGKVFTFKDAKNTGQYTWQSANARDVLGRVGGRYVLDIKLGSEAYRSIGRINRVPKIDSINYYFEKLPVPPPNNKPQEGYVAEFYGRDDIGEGDCYWIRASRNGKLFDKTFNIVVAYDAGFSPGAATDGLTFILPIRRSISTPIDLYQAKDTVKVELYSIGIEAFYFLNQVRNESNNAGLFATPPANIFTNIQNVNPNGRKALGFFGASAVSSLQTVIIPEKARPKPGN